ncbi:hypothetical protein [Streptomyces litchfieldiae]|uniref:DUF8017 domain-containing protein n=1 Tax=Streptomyces litchfieldiae TaxID=3075543 RepID=A0ABU2MHI1_9ACTN|nr:hypothetical protein [Streptomyces sp. DSM 44938]MDT0341062.1 hypothetical protein [Streptomyces sp. DSM 44938]
MSDRQDPAAGPPPPAPGTNPYLTPGYRQPDPYPPAPVARRGRAALAALVALAVLGTAAILGVSLLNGRDVEGEPPAVGDDDPAQPGEVVYEFGREPDDPRAPVPEEWEPVVADDWQVVVSSGRDLAFDVPPDWLVTAEGEPLWIDNEVDENAERPAFSLESGAVLEWAECDTGGVHGFAGTRGAQGTTGTEEGADLTARLAAWAAFYQEEEGTTDFREPEPYRNDHGITGHIAYATVEDIPDDPEDSCDIRAGLSVAVSYLDADDDLSAWSLIIDRGYEGEVSQETVDLIVGSLRPYDG